MPTYVDNITISVSGVDLDDVIISLSEKNDTASEAVKTMNKRRRAVAIKQGSDMFSLDLKVEPIVDPTGTVPDWHALKKKRTYFTIIKREAGATVTWSRCRITSVADDCADGTSSQSVSVLALDRDP